MVSFSWRNHLNRIWTFIIYSCPKYESEPLRIMYHSREVFSYYWPLESEKIAIDLYSGMPKDFDLRWKSDFRFIFFAWNFTYPCSLVCLIRWDTNFDASPWSAGQTADQKSNIKNVISFYTDWSIGMKLSEYIQFDPGYCMEYLSTSGRNLETGSWLFAMKLTMFWHKFFPRVNKNPFRDDFVTFRYRWKRKHR